MDKVTADKVILFAHALRTSASVLENDASRVYHCYSMADASKLKPGQRRIYKLDMKVAARMKRAAFELENLFNVMADKQQYERGGYP